jgi:nucleoid-associated protein YgaU
VQSARKQYWANRRRPRCAWLLCLAAPCLAAPIHGQSLGDIARQERARKASQQQAQQPTHVYDNDDLSRPQILAPEDKQRIEAPTQQVTSPTPAAPPAPPAPAAPAPAAAQATTPAPASKVSYVSNAPSTNSAPLGDIARYYRAQKAARQQQQQAPATPSAAQATTAAAASDESDTSRVTFVSPPANLNSMPLGDIARYYRAQKAARQQQQQASQSAEQYSAPSTPPDAQTTDTATVSSGSNSSSVSFVSTPPNLNSMPLGDIARYYRALKAAQRHQQAQSAEQHTLPAAQSLADPTFANPPTRTPQPLVPATEGPPHARLAPDAISRDEDGAAGGGAARIKIQRGDTLWNLARKYLGRGRNWMLLAAINPQLAVPTRLQIGTWVRLPLPDDVPDSGSGERVRVQAGDTLWKFSQAHFGDGRDWGCIARANPELSNPNLIFSGQVLKIPDSCTGAGPRTLVPAVSSEALPASGGRFSPPLN